MAVILPSVYKDGTATVAAGGTSVTGQSTLFLSSVLPGDFFGVHKGYALRIASVESNTALTLANPWPGAAQTAAAYEIMLQSDTARVQESTRQLLQKLLGGNLDALAGLIGAADKVPYFTGSGTMAVTDFKAKGRDIAAADTMTALLAKLGPVYGGTAPQPSNAGVGLSDGNFDTIIYPGIYTIGGNWTNGPTAAGSTTYTGSLQVTRREGNDGYWQIFRSSATGAAWKRFTSTANASSWPNAWQRIEHPVTGSVSMSGGLPVGSLFETGTNGNGRYVKFADGMMICTHSMDISGIAIATPRGSIFGFSSESLWTFPAAFAGFRPAILYEFERGDVAYTGGGSSITKGLTSTTFVVWNSSSNPAGNAKVLFVMAIGRWF